MQSEAPFPLTPGPLPQPERFKREQEGKEETESLQRAGAWLDEVGRGPLFGWSAQRKKSPASGLCTFLCSLRCLMFNCIISTQGEGAQFGRSQHRLDALIDYQLLTKSFSVQPNL